MVARRELEAELERARGRVRERLSASASGEAIARAVHAANDEAALEALSSAARESAGLRLASVHVRSRDIQGSTREILEDKLARAHRVLCAEGGAGAGERREIARSLRDGLGGDADYLLVDVDSLEIRALRGYPGPLARHVLETLGPDGMWDVVSRFVDRRAVWIYALGVKCLRTGESHFFEKSVHGTIIAPKFDGSFKNGIDSTAFVSMFQPIGALRTLSEMSFDERTKTSPRHAAIEQFLTFFKAKSSPATTFQRMHEAQSAEVRLSEDSGEDLPIKDSNIARIAKQAVLRSSPATSTPTSLTELLETSTRRRRSGAMNEDAVEEDRSHGDLSPVSTDTLNPAAAKPRGRPPGRPPGRPRGRPPGRPRGRPPGRPPGRPRGRPPGRPRKTQLPPENFPMKVSTRGQTARERNASPPSKDATPPLAPTRTTSNTISGEKPSLWEIVCEDTR